MRDKTFSSVSGAVLVQSRKSGEVCGMRGMLMYSVTFPPKLVHEKGRAAL